MRCSCSTPRDNSGSRRVVDWNALQPEKRRVEFLFPPTIRTPALLDRTWEQSSCQQGSRGCSSAAAPGLPLPVLKGAE